MKWYKKYVTNKAYPEGCIAQKYLDEEAMMYCKEYMNNGAKANYTRGLRTFSDYEDECAKPLDKKGKEYFLNTVEYEQARKWVLQQAVENSEREEKYNTYKENLNSRSQSRRGNRRTEKPIDYVSWLRQQLKTDEDYSFKKFVDGPSFKAISYKSYQVNGYVFCTSESEKHKSTQNSETTRENLSPLVGDWRDLEEEDKEYIRKEIFDLDPDEHQVMLDYKSNMALKNWKSRLRKNNCDAYETDEERKSKRPKGVKKEVWIKFVDRLSTPEEQAKREKRNAVISKMHSPHTTGRLGASGKKEILEKGRPKGSVKRAIQKDPMLMDKDLDNDAVAIEYEADENGHVRGYNSHLNKTNIRVLAPFRRVIERERVKQAMLNEVQESLEVEANERRQLKKRVAAFEFRESPRGAYMHRPFENNVSISQGRRCSPPPPESLSGSSCILKDVFGTNVAYGIVQFNITAPEGFYSVIIDEVIRKEACLYVESRTLGDVSAGEVVAWLKIFTIIQ
ncbi:hypothetical protein GIB67_029597 [Kingdonia uniflora]|uniref:DUF4218 domain-containing protein n=1 Tax=Kingdonia uniflora TaxID=39325 RepID=A0A7J7LLL5_9MAGN|nr:hypothetical protein GIB67_029597 [Kingdonia uniflora]